MDSSWFAFNGLTRAAFAAVGSQFFSRLASAHGDYAAAFERGVEIMLVFILAALAIALASTFCSCGAAWATTRSAAENRCGSSSRSIAASSSFSSGTGSA